MSEMSSVLQDKLQCALARHQQGELAQAEKLYQEIIDTQPDHFDALHLLGVLAAQSRDPRRAVELISRAIALDSAGAMSYFNRGTALQALQSWDAALADYDAAIARKPDFAEAYCNRGVVQKQLGRTDAALDSANRAIMLRAEFPEAHFNRGLALESLERWQEALESLERATALRPSYAQAFAHRGNVEERLQRWEAAAASYARAIALRPADAVAYLYRGNVLTKLGRFAAALHDYDEALRLQPNFAAAHCNRSAALLKLRRPQDALRSVDRAIALDAEFPEAHFNRGNVFADLDRFADAIMSYDRAIALKLDYADAHCNRGLALTKCNRLSEALSAYDEAIRLRADHVQARYNRAFARLLIGEFQRGWTDHELRWAEIDGVRVNGASREMPRHFREPAWSGVEPIGGATILLYSEQGLGDTLQFCRYVERVSALGATVVLEVQKPLVALLGNLAGVSQIRARGEPLPAFDYRCALLSLPRAFQTSLASIPGSLGYLKADGVAVARWRDKLQARTGPGNTRPRIGLVWSGAAVPDPNRSVPLSELLGALPAGYQYVSLTKDVRDSDRSTLASRADLWDYAAELTDFAATAALCECLDLIISIDTSVAHLAGALGRPTWVLLPFHPDWRWLLERSTSPWYASVTLYRQTARGDWRGALERMAADLRQRSFDSDRAACAEDAR